VLEEAVQARLLEGSAAQPDHLGGQPLSERAVPARRPGEHHEQAEVRQGEVHQEDPQVPGGDGDYALQGKHDEGDRHQAGDSAGGDLADDGRDPDRGEHREHAGPASPEIRGEGVAAEGKPEGLG
jgi:hypothetical protein